MKKTPFSIKRIITLIVFGGLFLLWACQNQSSENPTADVTGEELYVSYCQICHGSGEEAGPMAEVLTNVPLDLHYIAVRNDGEFPRDRIIRIIDGRSPNVRGHRNSEMPVFGKTFQESEGLESNREVRKEIELIVDYLESVQQDLE
jgi:mono/diheme cytochrome c family protein